MTVLQNAMHHEPQHFRELGFYWKRLVRWRIAADKYTFSQQHNYLSKRCEYLSYPVVHLPTADYPHA